MRLVFEIVRLFDSYEEILETLILHRSSILKSYKLFYLRSNFSPFIHRLLIFIYFIHFFFLFPKAKDKIVVFNQDFISYGETVAYRDFSAWHTAEAGGVASLVRSVTPFSINSPHTGWQDYKTGDSHDDNDGDDDSGIDDLFLYIKNFL